MPASKPDFGMRPPVIERSSSAPRLVRFGVFELDLRSGDLRKDGAHTRLNLPDQQLQFLTALLERPGELVTRDELRQRLWAEETFVDFEHGLNSAVKRLRDALGDSADRPRFIETVPRRGYRFIAPVSRDENLSASSDRLPVHSTEQRKTDDPMPHESQAGGPAVQPLASVDVLPTISSSPTPARPDGRGGHLARRALLTAVAGVAVALLAAGGWWTMRLPAARKAATVAQVQRHLTRLTSEPGLQTDVTWSPDGRFIAYASDRAGTFNIWVQPVAGGDAVQVTKSQEQDTEPDWSPDGSAIVFRSERDGGGLFVVPSLGGTERRLASFGVQPKWSPDGSQVLFASSPEIHARTYVVSLDNSPPHPILEGFEDDELLGVKCRAWHPDGRVSFLGLMRKEGFALYTVPLSGGRRQVTRIIPDARDAPEVVQFEWAPSGAAVYFEGRINHVSNVWRVAVDPGSLEAGGLERLTTGSGQDTRVALSRDGRYAAFATLAETVRFWSFPFDAAEGRLLGEGQPVTATTTAVFDAEIAPEGRRMAYSLTGVGSAVSELWTEDLVSGEKRRLARDTVTRRGAKWSPDGSRLAYKWVRETGTKTEARYEQTVAVRPAAGGDELLLSAPLVENAVPYGWSPDGQSVLVSTRLSTGARPRFPKQSSVAITLWSLASAPHAFQSARVLASSPDVDLWHESFSPNGRWILFEAVKYHPEAMATLYVMPSTGGAPAHWTRLTDPQGFADRPRWSPDGKGLYFWGRQGSLYNVWALRFDDAQGIGVGAPFQVTHFDGRARQIATRDLGVSAQSVSRTRLLLPMTDTTGSIWMLDKMDR
jgi:Tol biopolymer transport system component/DNA-binding winged helix-turn-helix (wHTH) protein